MSKTKKSSSSLSSKAKKFSRAGLAVLSSIPTPGWGSASKKALAVSVSRSKVKKTSTKNKNQTNKKTSKKLSSLKNLLKRLSQKSRYGRMYTNARKLSSERDQLNKQEKLKLAMLIAVDALATGRSEKKQEEKNPFIKSLESIGEIGVDFWKAAEERDKKKFDSVSDFINYLSLGALGGAKSAYDAGAERSKKMFDSPYGFGNWLTNGSFDLVNGAFNPEDPLSKEHWLSSFGLAGTVVGGGAAAQALRVGRNTKSGTSSGATKEKKAENIQGESGTEGTKSLKHGTLSNVEARSWYLEQEAKIPSLINKNAPLEQQARQAFNLRNQYRTEARNLMSDRNLAASLSKTDPNLTWEQVIQRQKDKGLTGDDIYKGIIESSQKSRKSVNESLGLK